MPATPRRSATAARLRQIIARTGASCYLCGKPIDYSLKTPDPGSFEIEHVIPLSKGGTDTLSNVKAAHRSCNSRKRARTVAPIVRRSGSLN